MLSRSVLCLLLVAAAALARPEPKQILLGAEDTLIEKHPHMVSIRHLGIHTCGGAIIGQRHILTAAHCITPFLPGGDSWAHQDDLTVVTGTGNLRIGGVVHKVLELHVHKKYVPEKEVKHPGNDIGVIKLTKSIEFDKYQKPIGLPSTNLPDGAKVTIAAWGATKMPIAEMSAHLQEFTLPTIGPEECKLYHNRGFVTNADFCTVSPEGVGTCKGDSGSPVIYQGRVVGVVSRGMLCAFGKPDIHTNVYKYRSFIEGIVLG